MIKLFRNIRQRLLSEGKTGKYFKYAIGEIILVVIGILIALQINNWNEGRKTRATEKVYLENIKVDLQLNQKSLKTFIETRQETITSVDSILVFFENDKVVNLNTFNFHCITVLGWYPYEQHDNTYQELLNSGKLSILSDKSIKNSLQNLQSNLKTVRFIESEMEEDYERYLYEPFFSTLDLHTSLKNFKAQTRKDKPIAILDSSEVHLLLKNKTFKNGFVLAAFNSEDLIGEYKNMIATINQLIILIDKNLDNH